jgi:hypothetical protein
MTKRMHSKMLGRIARKKTSNSKGHFCIALFSMLKDALR